MRTVIIVFIASLAIPFMTLAGEELGYVKVPSADGKGTTIIATANVKFKVGSGCSEDVSWISSTELDRSSQNCSLYIEPGFFSKDPVCTCTAVNGLGWSGGACSFVHEPGSGGPSAHKLRVTTDPPQISFSVICIGE